MASLHKMVILGNAKNIRAFWMCFRGNLSAAAEQLSIGSEQVLRSEKELAEIAEDAAFGSQNVAASIEEQLASKEEISASADSLAHMVEELQLQIRRFKV